MLNRKKRKKILTARRLPPQETPCTRQRGHQRCTSGGPRRRAPWTRGRNQGIASRYGG